MSVTVGWRGDRSATHRVWLWAGPVERTPFSRSLTPCFLSEKEYMKRCQTYRMGYPQTTYRAVWDLLFNFCGCAIVVRFRCLPPSESNENNHQPKKWRSQWETRSVLVAIILVGTFFWKIFIFRLNGGSCHVPWIVVGSLHRLLFRVAQHRDVLSLGPCRTEPESRGLWHQLIEASLPSITVFFRVLSSFHGAAACQTLSDVRHAARTISANLCRFAAAAVNLR